MQQPTFKLDLPLRACGAATVAAGACYLPLVLLTGWQSVAAIATPSWWLVQSLATAHHLFLLFGLIGIYATALERPGASALGAFTVASIGNVMVAGVGAIQLTILPALAAHPAAASGLDCTPFYQAATASAAAFIAAACTPWQFGALEAWVIVAWMAMLGGSLWLAAGIFRRGAVSRSAGALLGVGWLLEAAALAAPLPEAVARAGYLAIALAYGWIGVELALGRLRVDGRAAGGR